MTPLLIGLDVGTTHVKAVLLEPGAGVRHVARRSTPTRRHAGGGAGHDPSELVAAALAVATECAEAAGPRSVGAIGVASMAEAGVPLDRAGRPLGEIVAWYDQRSAPEAAWLESEIGGARALFARTGLRADAKYSLPKLLWWRAHRGAAYRRTWQWAGVAELVARRLVAGESGPTRLTTNASLACRTLAFDVAARRWDEDLLRLAALSPGQMPEVVPLGRPHGALDGEVAAGTGLRPGIPVAVAGHDHLVGAIGAGLVRPGAGLDSMGSAEVALVVTDRPFLGDSVRAAGFSSGCHAADDRWYVLGGLQSSGALVEWWIDTFLGRRARTPRPVGSPYPAGRARAEDTSLPEAGRYERFVRLLEAATAAPGEILVSPYLRGRTAPDPDPGASMEIAGLAAAHATADVGAAVLDGTAFHVRWMFERLEAVAAARLSTVRATGGGTRNRRWLAAKAALGPWSYDVARTDEAAALGAALVAGMASGTYVSLEDALADAAPADAVTVLPELRARYDRAYHERWLPWIAARRRD